MSHSLRIRSRTAGSAGSLHRVIGNTEAKMPNKAKTRRAIKSRNVLVDKVIPFGIRFRSTPMLMEEYVGIVSESAFSRSNSVVLHAKVSIKYLINI
jgi:hypothetical protein